MISEQANRVFDRAIADYHIHNSIDFPLNNPFPAGELAHLLYLKCWIDTVQWHMEDEVRNPDIAPEDGLQWKRRIDESNQERTDTVEYIDSYFLEQFRTVTPLPDARINTESPAWAIDRLSILALKIYHMKQEADRTNASEQHRRQCGEKLSILNEQRSDLSRSIDELLDDIRSGRKYMKVYRQMKMYNDPALNPVLYTKP
jgi:hypothetical protein